jgi:Zn ribbon nucleic-acid-binding protein
MPAACARCGCADGIALYATSRVRYFGCVKCRHLNVVSAPIDAAQQAAGTPAAGAEERVRDART